MRKRIDYTTQIAALRFKRREISDRISEEIKRLEGLRSKQAAEFQRRYDESPTGRAAAADKAAAKTRMSAFIKQRVLSKGSGGDPIARVTSPR